MKALIYKNGTINLEERERPKIIDSRDAIVKVKISSICTSDLHIIHGHVPKAINNIALGHEFVGEIVELGTDVKNLSIGDRVSANVETFCGECYFCKQDCRKTYFAEEINNKQVWICKDCFKKIMKENKGEQL